MSHFTRIQTKLVDRSGLIKAFADLGYQVNEVAGKVRGYRMDVTTAPMRVENVQRGYDIGILDSPEGFELVADWSMLNMPDFLPRLKQRYAYQVTCTKLEQQGFTLVEEQTETDGQLHLLLRRMS